jgi:hypothetical protein
LTLNRVENIWERKKKLCANVMEFWEAIYPFVAS